MIRRICRTGLVSRPTGLLIVIARSGLYRRRKNQNVRNHYNSTEHGEQYKELFSPNFAFVSAMINRHSMTGVLLM